MNFIPDDLYGVIYNRVPRVCVDLVIKNGEGTVLLSRRGIEPYKGCWHLPGGGIKFKETMTDAAKRIAQRELGVEIEVGEALGICESINDDISPEKPRHSISVVVEVAIVAGQCRVSDETAEIGYFDLNSLPEEIQPYQGGFLKNLV